MLQKICRNGCLSRVPGSSNFCTHARFSQYKHFKDYQETAVDLQDFYTLISTTEDMPDQLLRIQKRHQVLRLHAAALFAPVSRSV